MSKPAISVIIPSYNPTKHIKQCLGSLLKQTFKDFEVIVVDDGSNDKKMTPYLEEMSRKDPRIRIVWNRHQGVALSRKTGFLLSKGNYIFFMDHDDFITDNAFERLYEYATKTEADITIGNTVRVVDCYGLVKISKPYNNEVGSKLIRKENLLSECYRSLEMRGDDPVRMVCTGRLYRSSLIRQAMSESDKDLFVLVKTEDWWFNLVLMPYINSIFLMEEIIYYYRYGGITNTISFRQRNNADYFNYRYDQFEKWNFQEGHSRTYACFSAVLYDSLKYLILSESYSQDEILAFLRKQTSNKIVDWARNNMVQIESLPQYYKQFATEEPEIIYCWLSNALHSKRAKRHRALKKCVLACSKVLDVIYQTLH